MTGQAQVVAQVEHAIEVLLSEYLVEQAHEEQISSTLTAELVVETAAGQSKAKQRACTKERY